MSKPRGVPWVREIEWKKQSGKFCTGGVELRKPNTLTAGLSAFRLYPAVNHPAGGKRLGN
jgi:hypothetical protein